MKSQTHCEISYNKQSETKLQCKYFTADVAIIMKNVMQQWFGSLSGTNIKVNAMAFGSCSLVRCIPMLIQLHLLAGGSSYNNKRNFDEYNIPRETWKYGFTYVSGIYVW